MITKENASTSAATMVEAAVGADFVGHVPNTEFNTVRMELRHFFAGVIR